MLRVKSKKQKLNLNLSGIPWRLPELMARLQGDGGCELERGAGLGHGGGSGLHRGALLLSFRGAELRDLRHEAGANPGGGTKSGAGSGRREAPGGGREGEPGAEHRPHFHFGNFGSAGGDRRRSQRPDCSDDEELFRFCVLTACLKRSDAGLGPRLLGSLAYILPVTEAFKLMLPLIQVFPPLGIVFGPITLLTVLLNFAPFVPLLLFVLFIVLAQSKET